ncbi:MAG: hypothetical protein ACTSYL_06175 [Candidatus Thorarchaeota archaeon]
MRHTSHRTQNDSRLETIFISVNAASFVAILLYGIFFIGYLLSNPNLITTIQTAIANRDVATLQQALELIDAGVMSVTGWVRLALGLGFLFLSFLFMVNIGGTIFSVFVHRPFTAGGPVTRSFLRQSLSRGYLSLKLLLFIALYKAAGLRGLAIIREFFPGSSLLGVSFFLNSVLNLSTLIVLASVIKVVVYEVRRYEVLVEKNRQSVLESLDEFIRRWKNSSIILEEGRFSQDSGYVRAKLEDATRDMRTDLRLLEAAKSNLIKLATPSDIIKKLMLTFVGIVVLQMLTDAVLYIGWSTVLGFIIGLLTGNGWIVI